MDRFVYYETLVTSMKSLGVREPVISYDDLKVKSQHFILKKKKRIYIYILLAPQAECVRKRQYGYVESAALLAASGTLEIRFPFTTYKSRNRNNQRSLLEAFIFFSEWRSYTSG